MPPSPADDRTDLARATLARYAEPLLRSVVARLVKSRMQPPTDELVDKLLSTLTNPPVVDRRIRDLPESARKLLAVIGLGRRPAWKVGHLITLLSSIGHAEGFGPVLTLLQSGLLFPDLTGDGPDVADFEAWLGSAGTLHATVFALPSVAARRGPKTSVYPTSASPNPTATPSPPGPRSGRPTGSTGRCGWPSPGNKCWRCRCA